MLSLGVYFLGCCVEIICRREDLGLLFWPSSSLSESNSWNWYLGGLSGLIGARVPGGALLVTLVVISLAAIDIISAPSAGNVSSSTFRRTTRRLSMPLACFPSAASRREQAGHLIGGFNGEEKLMIS